MESWMQCSAESQNVAQGRYFSCRPLWEIEFLFVLSGGWGALLIKTSALASLHRFQKADTFPWEQLCLMTPHALSVVQP
jgi:hypothetical protein